MKALIPLLIFVGTTGLAQGQAPVKSKTVVKNAHEKPRVSEQTRAKLEVAKKIIKGTASSVTVRKSRKDAFA